MVPLFIPTSDDIEIPHRKRFYARHSESAIESRTVMNMNIITHPLDTARSCSG